MATQVNLKKILHKKSQEACSPALLATTAGSFIVSDKSGILPGQPAFYVAGVSNIYMYQSDSDSWLQLPNSGATGTFAVGACGELKYLSAPAGNITNTVSAGTTTTITTTLTIVKNLAGLTLRIVGGTGIGYNGSIAYSTTGANAIITLNTPSGVAFDATTQYQIYGGSLWFMNAGTVAVGFSVYDIITNTWTARSVTNLPTAWGTDAQLVSTPGLLSNNGLGLVNSTATAGGASTLTDGTKNFPINGFTNNQVRIISGTGIGQIRTIASNTATVLTVSSAWTIQPDTTSVYRIEGNDDFMYLAGNNAVTLYKYVISTNTWSVLSPGVARAGAIAGGGSLNYIDSCSDTKWSDETYTTLVTGITRQNGRYIYSFRGGATATLDVYDIALNTWINGIAYGNSTTTFTIGSHSCDIDGNIYLQKEITNYFYKFSVANNRLDPWTFIYVTQGAVLGGNRIFPMQYKDGNTKLTYIYNIIHTGILVTRILDI